MKSFKTHVNEAKKGGFVDKAFKTAMAFGAASGVLAGSKALSTRAAPVPQQAIRVTQTAPAQQFLQLSKFKHNHKRKLVISLKMSMLKNYMVL